MLNINLKITKKMTFPSFFMLSMKKVSFPMTSLYTNTKSTSETLQGK